MSIGSKESLIPLKHTWQEVKHFGDHYYLYQCNEKIEIQVAPIIVRHKIDFTGIILPVFPVKVDKNYRQDNFKMSFRAKGLPTEELVSSVNINGIAEEFSVSNTSPYLNHLTVSKHLIDIDTAEITFVSGVSNCKIPAFSISKHSGFWHEVIFSMGP